MPVDGTYGRLSAHNQRFKELRRKKLERRENKILNKSFSNSYNDKSNAPYSFNTVDPEKLKQIKIEIQKKAKAQLRKEFYIYMFSFITTGLLFYYIFFH